MAYFCGSLVLFRSVLVLTLLPCFGCTRSHARLLCTVVMKRLRQCHVSNIVLCACSYAAMMFVFSGVISFASSCPVFLFVRLRLLKGIMSELLLFTELRCCVWRVGWVGRLGPRRLENMCGCPKGTDELVSLSGIVTAWLSLMIFNLP